MRSKRVSKDHWSHLASPLNLAGLPPQRWTSLQWNQRSSSFVFIGRNFECNFPPFSAVLCPVSVFSFVSTQLIWRACFIVALWLFCIGFQVESSSIEPSIFLLSNWLLCCEQMHIFRFPTLIVFTQAFISIGFCLCVHGLSYCLVLFQWRAAQTVGVLL